MPFRIVILTFFFMLSTHFAAHSQTNLESDILVVKEKKTPPANQPTYTAKNKTPDYYRHFKKLSSAYRGFLIELVQADAPLRRDYPLFKYFGNVHYEVLKDGKFAYYIKGDQFTQKKSLLRFYEDVILPQAPNAKIVEKKGL